MRAGGSVIGGTAGAMVGTSMAAAATAGGAYGSAVGPVGAVIGGIVGAASVGLAAQSSYEIIVSPTQADAFVGHKGATTTEVLSTAASKSVSGVGHVGYVAVESVASIGASAGQSVASAGASVREMGAEGTLASVNQTATRSAEAIASVGAAGVTAGYTAAGGVASAAGGAVKAAEGAASFGASTVTAGVSGVYTAASGFGAASATSVIGSLNYWTASNIDISPQSLAQASTSPGSPESTLDHVSVTLAPSGAMGK